MILGIDGRVITWHIGSGLATYTTNLMSNMQRLGELKGLCLLYPYRNTTDIFDIDSIPKNMLVGERRSDFWPNIYQTQWDLDFPIDIFHNTVNGIGLPRSFKGHNVITLHDLIPYVMPETVDRAHLDFTLKYTPYILENVSHIVTVSNYSKQDIQRYFGIDDDKITVTHLAADAIYQPMNRDKARSVIFNKYGVDKRYILYLGGFSLRKNIERLVRSFKRVHNESMVPLNLLILGEHSRSYPVLSKLAEDLGIGEAVKFLNFVPTDDLPYFYNGAEVFVYPSLYEGFGLPPLESMQCGTPVVTSNVSSIPEIVGNGCVLIDPYSVEQIGDAILNLLHDPALWQKYSMLGQQKAKEYSWTETARKTLEVYKSCMK